MIRLTPKKNFIVFWSGCLKQGFLVIEKYPTYVFITKKVLDLDDPGVCLRGLPVKLFQICKLWPDMEETLKKYFLLFLNMIEISKEVY